jgi:hypothetical protein
MLSYFGRTQVLFLERVESRHKKSDDDVIAVLSARGDAMR